MAQLTLEQRQDRLRFDYLVAMDMRCPIMSITAYRTDDDLGKRSNPVVSEEDGHLATHYLVDYRINTLIAAGTYHDKFSIKFDLLANGNYPYSRPGCYVVLSKMPWTPHFRKNLPVCIDREMWENYQGKMLLGSLMVHVAKLLNFDEIPRSETYGGYNPEAADYWREHLNRQPINPNLVYPPLPPWVSSIPDPVMRPKGIEPADGSPFKPKSAVNESQEHDVRESPLDTTSFGFRPATRQSSAFTPKARSTS